LNWVRVREVSFRLRISVRFRIGLELESELG
jgi:hypothetical protein